MSMGTAVCAWSPRDRHELWGAACRSRRLAARGLLLIWRVGARSYNMTNRCFPYRKGLKKQSRNGKLGRGCFAQIWCRGSGPIIIQNILSATADNGK
jgi:hypothetical protein